MEFYVAALAGLVLLNYCAIVCSGNTRCAISKGSGPADAPRKFRHRLPENSAAVAKWGTQWPPFWGRPDHPHPAPNEFASGRFWAPCVDFR